MNLPYREDNVRHKENLKKKEHKEGKHQRKEARKGSMSRFLRRRKRLATFD